MRANADENSAGETQPAVHHRCGALAQVHWRQFHAAASNFPNVVQALLDHGANARVDMMDGDDDSESDSSWGTPLHAAARWWAPECVRLLLEHDPSIRDCIDDW